MIDTVLLGEKELLPQRAQRKTEEGWFLKQKTSVFLCALCGLKTDYAYD